MSDFVCFLEKSYVGRSYCTCVVFVAVVIQGWCHVVTRHPYGNVIGTNMPKRSSVLPLVPLLALYSVRCRLCASPTGQRKTQIAVVAGSVAASGAAPVITDVIVNAARYFSDASCLSLKEIDQSSLVYNGKPGSGSASTVEGD